MSFLYAGYLVLVLFGALAFMHVFSISFSSKQKKSILFSLILTTIIFSLWDAWAVLQGHWQFGLPHMLGAIVGNLPLEEIGFFIIIPFFGIILWEIAGKLDAARKNNHTDVKKR